MIITRKYFNRYLKEYRKNLYRAEQLALQLKRPESESTWVKFIEHSHKNFLKAVKVID